MKPSERWWRGLVALVLVGLLPFVLASNFFDWDTFLSYHEVDARAWWEGSLPLWSYQLCAGATRLGDPQALSLSPMFAWVLLFGSLWGTKLLVYGCLLLGFGFARQLFRLWAQAWDTSLSATSLRWADVLALALIAGNFFLWHLHVGHVTFAWMGLGLGVVYYTWKAWLRTFRARDWVSSVLLAFTFYAGGFYQATVFLLVPLFLSLALALLGLAGVSLWRGQTLRVWWRKLMVSVGFHLLGLGLASFKLYGILAYQRDYPRTVHATTETISWLHLLAAQLLPTWQFRWLGLWRADSPHRYGMWEHSHFNVLVWVLLLYGGFLVWRRLRSPTTQTSAASLSEDSLPQETPEKAPETPEDGPTSSEKAGGLSAAARRGLIVGFVGVYGVVVLAFSLGDFARWAPHALLNRMLLQGSVRVVMRYQVGLTLWVAMVLALIFVTDPRFRAWFRRYLAVAAVVLVGLNGLTFAESLSLEQFLFWSRARVERTKPMRWMIIAPHKQGQLTPMFQALRMGMGVVNCYVPFRIDPKAFTRELPHTRHGPTYDGNSSVAQSRLRPLPLIDTRSTPVSQACLQGSYFTPSQVVLHPSCPPRVCLNIRQPHRYHPTNFAFDPQVGKYCRGVVPAGKR